MAFNLRSHGMVALVVVEVWMLMCCSVDGSTTFRPGNARDNGDAVGLEGIPDVLDPNDEMVTGTALEAASTPVPEANEINCHFTLHQRSRVGGRCMSLGSQLIKTCVASIIYFDTENVDCLHA